MRLSKPKLKTDYFVTLEYLVRQCHEDSDYIDARLSQYRKLLASESSTDKISENATKGVVRSLVNNSIMPWRKKYRFWLLCDIALIFLDETVVKSAYSRLREFLSNKQTVIMDGLFALLWNDSVIPATLSFATELIDQFRINRSFGKQPESRIIVTANMSAGKSTIINALIGKPLTQTAQEACTGDLCYLYNKPFEDDAIHLFDKTLRLSAKYDDLAKTERSDVSYIASSFRSLIQPQNRICIIDTPGVNSAINREHGRLTRKAIMEERYDRLIYVFNANKLGTDEEFSYLKFVSENVSKGKIVFVLNKLDDFKHGEDSIASSIEGVKNDLLKFGFENPVVCPFSAYFALLLKMKHNGEMLTDDEQDVYDLYVKKFSKPEYDLSLYSGDVQNFEHSNELTKMASICGLFRLENILFGGMN
jgi:signal recognition particle receptor subunit beta